MVKEPTKVCSRCRTRKPYSLFHPIGRDKEARGSRCKECDKQYQREYREKNPERVIHYRKTNYARVKSDPERYMIRLEAGRESKRRIRGTPPNRFRVSRVMREHVKGRYVGGGASFLDASPFTKWLRTLGGDSVTIGNITGLPDRSVRAFLGGERRFVRKATVDRACSNTFTPMETVYPLGGGLAVAL